jgi:hypothetical protein
MDRDALEKRLGRLERGLTRVELPGGGSMIITPAESARGLVSVVEALMGKPTDPQELQRRADLPAAGDLLGVTSELARRVLRDGPLTDEELEDIAKSCDGDFAPNSETGR